MKLFDSFLVMLVCKQNTLAQVSKLFLHGLERDSVEPNMWPIFNLLLFFNVVVVSLGPKNNTSV